jgi:hypothetical protein
MTFASDQEFFNSLDEDQKDYLMTRGVEQISARSVDITKDPPRDALQVGQILHPVPARPYYSVVVDADGHTTKADGRSVLKTKYPLLYDVLVEAGLNYGAKDDEHFNLPNFSDREHTHGH